MTKIVYFEGRVVKVGEKEVRIYIYSKYKERVGEYAGWRVRGLLLIEEEEKKVTMRSCSNGSSGVRRRALL